VAYEIPGFSFTLVAGEDLTSSQFCAVDVEVSTGNVILPTKGERAIGVIQNKPDDGEAATIVVTGVTKVLVGVGGLIAGNNVTVDDDGTIIQAASGDRCLGIALSTGAEASLQTVLLLNGGATVAGS
jgi:hypothetical protein